MAVALKRLPLRCILCRAKVLKLHQDGKREEQLPKSVSGYNIANNISFGSNYSFTSGKFYHCFYPTRHYINISANVYFKLVDHVSYLTHILNPHILLCQFTIFYFCVLYLSYI